MSVKSIAIDWVYMAKSTRAKGGYEVWSVATEGPIDPETWMTRMGARRRREALEKLYPNVQMVVVYVHYLHDRK